VVAAVARRECRAWRRRSPERSPPTIFSLSRDKKNEPSVNLAVAAKRSCRSIHRMPYVDIRITKDGVTAQQKALIVKEVAETLGRVLGKAGTVAVTFHPSGIKALSKRQEIEAA
jgi:hypothetical protein